MFFKRGWRGWVWPVLLAAAIALASGRSDVPSTGITGFDKVTHFLVFGLLATLVARNGFVPGFGWLAVVVVSLYGLVDEWHQSFTPGRSVEVADWVADTLGAAVAVLLYARWPWYRGRLEASLDRRQPRVENRPDIGPTGSP